jgi:hypothetical protein
MSGQIEFDIAVYNRKTTNDIVKALFLPLQLYASVV